MVNRIPVTPSRPFVSVVIPAYNEEYVLADCLTALEQQQYDGPYEVIVVNNASTDHTPEIARSKGARVVDEPRKGNVHALRAGLAAAQGEIVACTDADTRASPDWICRLVSHLTAQPGVVAAGGIFAFYDGPAWLRLGSLLVNQMGWHLQGVNMAMWRWAYEQIGGLDPMVNFGADAVLGLRLRRLGRVVIDRRLVMRTSARRFQAALWKTLWLYWINDLWLALFARCLFYSFPDIRILPAPRPARRRWALAGVVLAVFALLAFSALSPGAQVFGKVVAHGRPGEKVVALTFDDGPSPYTAQVLDILARYQVKATFFLIGQNVERHPDLARRIVAEGHAVGNHTYSHPLWGAAETPVHDMQELNAAETAIFRATGIAPNLFRPPHGWRSPWMVRIAHSLGYRVVTWNVAAGDWDRPQPQVIAEHVLSRLRPGAIVLLHDGLETQADPAMQNTVAALPLIIEGLQARGYRLVTVPELIQLTEDKREGGSHAPPPTRN
jgi:peptidoglycan-N-acetylglucosamine deacetylase